MIRIKTGEVKMMIKICANHWKTGCNNFVNLDKSLCDNPQRAGKKKK